MLQLSYIKDKQTETVLSLLLNVWSIREAIIMTIHKILQGLSFKATRNWCYSINEKINVSKDIINLVKTFDCDCLSLRILV